MRVLPAGQGRVNFLVCNSGSPHCRVQLRRAAAARIARQDPLRPRWQAAFAAVVDGNRMALPKQALPGIRSGLNRIGPSRALLMTHLTHWGRLAGATATPDSPPAGSVRAAGAARSTLPAISCRRARPPTRLESAAAGTIVSSTGNVAIACRGIVVRIGSAIGLLLAARWIVHIA